MTVDLDQEAVRSAMNPESRRVFDEVSARINAAIDGLIDDFRTRCDKVRQEFALGKYPAALSDELTTIRQSLDSDLKQFTTSLADIASDAEALAELSHSAGAMASQLAAKSSAVSQKAAALNKRLDDFRSRLNSFGANSGQAIASALMKAVIGVV